MTERLDQGPAGVDDITMDIDDLIFDPNDDIEQNDPDLPSPSEIDRFDTAD